jgi:hypothetical protein
MVPADTVLQDFAHNKFVIQGTFSGIFASEFPWRSTPIAVYTAITNGHGRTPLVLRLIDVDEVREPIAESRVVVDFADPLVVSEVIFVLADVVFPEPGEYRLQLFVAGQPLRERRLQVVPAPN